MGIPAADPSRSARPGRVGTTVPSTAGTNVRSAPSASTCCCTARICSTGSARSSSTLDTPASSVARSASSTARVHARRERRTALHHRLVEQARAHRHGAQERHGGRAGRLAEDRDVARVAAERRAVGLHPSQGLDAVEQAPVRRRRPSASAARSGWPRNPSSAEAVVDRDHDHVAPGRQRRALVERAGARAGAEGAAVDPHHDRPAAHRRRPGVHTLSDRHCSSCSRSARWNCAPGDLGRDRTEARSHRDRPRSSRARAARSARRSRTGCRGSAAIPSLQVPRTSSSFRSHRRCSVHEIPLVTDVADPRCAETGRIRRYGQDVTASMPDPAPTVDGRRARRHRSRDLAVDALLDLLGEGVLRPTAQQVAERSGVSLRSIFRIFDDVETLNAAAAARQLSRVRHLFVDVHADGHAAGAGRRRSSTSTAACTSRSPRSAGPPCGRPRSRRPCRSSSPGPGAGCAARSSASSPPELRHGARDTAAAVELVLSFEAWDQLRSAPGRVAPPGRGHRHPHRHRAAHDPE